VLAASTVLRITIGGFLVVTGILKLRAIGSADFESTLVWRLSGESGVIIAALSIAEMILGLAFLFRLVLPVAATVTIALAVAGAIAVLHEHWRAESAGQDAAPCGCIGVGARESLGTSSALLRSCAVAFGSIATLAWSRASQSVREVEQTVDPPENPSRP